MVTAEEPRRGPEAPVEVRPKHSLPRRNVNGPPLTGRAERGSGSSRDQQGPVPVATISTLVIVLPVPQAWYSESTPAPPW